MQGLVDEFLGRWDYRPGTLLIKRRYLSRWLARFPTCEMLSEPRISSYCRKVLRGPRAWTTKMHELCVVRQWLRFLHSRQLTLSPWHDCVPLPRPSSRRSPRCGWSPDQVANLLESVSPTIPFGLRDRALLEMAYATGLRQGELNALDLGDVDLADGLVIVRDSKNRCDRQVPLTRWAQSWLFRYLHEVRPLWVRPHTDGALWLSPRGKRLCLDSHLTALQDRNGLAPFGFHDFRRALATHLLERGAQLREVQELLGHKRLESSEPYLLLTTQRLRDVHALCHPRTSENNASSFQQVLIVGS